MKKRILVSDDDLDIREFVCAVIGQLGHECVLASGGEEAINAYATARHTDCAYDLLILDLAMPYTNGFAVAEKIRGSGDESTPILFMTGYGEDIQDRAYTFSSFPVFSKPFAVRDLIQRVEGIFGCAA